MNGHDEYGHDGGEEHDGYDYQEGQGEDDGQGMAGHLGMGLEGQEGQDPDVAHLTHLVVKLIMEPQPGPSHVPKPQHAHSRFAQDPHHAEAMMLLDKIASEPIHEAHLESMIHVGLLLLARLAKKVGMTAGHDAQSMGMGMGMGMGAGAGAGAGMGADPSQMGHGGMGAHGGEEGEGEGEEGEGEEGC
ncbi:hypothetical protein AYL99_10754 [Fonsecaea erecta]|uniref:Uncharacterized protein n=1 Tax=Fonsecaea erecta TaxID=1367422 RepID=A0A178Z5K7_9EURO|nr:hypothetical protein AYL99_10754 [Fonsecaea erecta]OAP55054.1 hypothetical protein AYL99_10754 [Fonsecaea erecta]